MEHRKSTHISLSLDDSMVEPDDVDLVARYAELQRLIINKGLSPLPGYVTLTEWRNDRVDSYRDKANARNAVLRGAIAGAVQIGGVWFVPKGAPYLTTAAKAAREYTPSSQVFSKEGFYL